jgi:DNA-binding NarL/FixJ family response regulator
MILLEFSASTTRDLWKMSLQYNQYKVLTRPLDLSFREFIHRHYNDIEIIYLSPSNYLNLNADDKRALASFPVLVGLEKSEFAFQYHNQTITGLFSLELGFSEFTKALRQLGHGEIYRSDDILKLDKRLIAVVDRLSLRRREIFILRTKGMTNSQAAEQMGISTSTVKNQVKETSRFFMQRLGMSYEAVRQAYKVLQPETL